MRICTFSFDAFGDMVLREPFFRALLAKGHELAAVTREEYRVILPYISPAIRSIPVARAAPEEKWRLDFDELEPRLRQWRPDAIAVLEASVSTTPFAGPLSQFLKRQAKVFRIGMTFAEDPRAAGVLGYNKVVKVGVNSHECAKYQKLLSSWLKIEADARPVLRIPDNERQDVLRQLEMLGLSAGQFAVSCPEGTTLIKNKGVPPAMTVTMARHLYERYQLPTLFVGVEAERPALQALIEDLSAQGVPARLWIGDTNGFPMLMGLLEQAVLYAGCDTGPMHIAAGLGLPVLAVFGGGTYPRFLPATTRTVSLTQKMPCSPCAWSCPYPAPPPCIAMVRPERLLKGIDRLLEGAARSPVHDVGDYAMRWEA